MAKAAGVITLRMKAGTAELFTDMDKAKAKVLEFGGATKASSAYATAALKELHGHFGDNSKAIAKFLTQTLGLGPVLQAAFPVIGGLAFGTMVVDLGSKVAAFFKDMQTAPEKVSGALREMAAPLRLTNDELAITNARLENDIAKLEGRRQNTLQLALLEAREAADKLGDSLEKDLGTLDKLLKENAVGTWQNLFGKAKTEDLRKLFGGETGAGGLHGAVAALMDSFTGDLTPARQAELNTRLLRIYQAALDTVRAKLAQGPSISLLGTVATGAPAFEDNRVRNEELQAAARMLQEEMTRISATATGTGLRAKKEALESAAANDKLTRPFGDRVKAMEAQLEGAYAKLEQAGMGPSGKAIGNAYAEALKAIAEVNKALEEHHLKLTADQEAQIHSLAGLTALTTLEAQWKERLAQTTSQIHDRVRSQEMLTAAIGRGAEAEMRARVETQVMGAVGSGNYGNAGWMKEHAGDVEKLRSGFLTEAQAQRTTGSAEAVDSLGKEIRLQNLLTAAQAQGEEAIRRVTAAEILRAGIEKGLTGQQIALQIQRYYSDIRLEQTKRIESLKAETMYTERLAAAQVNGADAARKQDIENKVAEATRTQGPVMGEALRSKLESDYQAEITSQVGLRMNLYSNQLGQLDQERHELLEIIGAHKATADQARVLRDLQQERLRLWVQEQLAIGTARAGVRAFFAEMQMGATRVGNIIYDSLTSAVDRASNELAKLFTGQRPEFGKMVQELGQAAVRDSIKAGMQKGLGELGKLLGIKMPEGKPDFTKAKPGHVIVENWPGPDQNGVGGSGALSGVSSGVSLADLLKGGGAVAGILGLLQGVFGLFGSGSAGSTESVSSIFTPMASGGEMVAGGAYLVGERGPEPFFPGVNGTMLSHALAKRAFGGAGDTYNTTNVDARGAELGVERRVYRAIQMAHQSAVTTSARVAYEQKHRVPQRSGA